METPRRGRVSRGLTEYFVARAFSALGNGRRGQESARREFLPPPGRSRPPAPPAGRRAPHPRPPHRPATPPAARAAPRRLPPRAPPVTMEVHVHPHRHP